MKNLRMVGSAAEIRITSEMQGVTGLFESMMCWICSGWDYDAKLMITISRSYFKLRQCYFRVTSCQVASCGMTFISGLTKIG